MKRHRRTVRRFVPHWPKVTEIPARGPAGTAGIVAILVLAFALRVYRLAHLSFWLDEGYSAFAAGLPLPDLLQFVASRAHPPLYFLLLHGWAWLGQADFVLRFLSVLWGVVGVAALYALGRRLLGRRIGLLAALLLAVSPMHVWHSQDARMYSQLFALAVLSTYLLVRAVDEGRLRYWLGYALLATLFFYTHNTAALTVGSQVVFCLGMLAARRQRTGPGRPGWSQLRGLGMALAVIALLYLPWLPVSAAQTGRLEQHFWIPRPTGRSVLDTLDYMSSAFLFTRSPWQSDLDAWPGALLYLAFLGLLLLGAWQLVRRSPRRRSPPGGWSVLLALLLAAPIAGEFVASHMMQPIYLNRTLVVVAAPLFLVYGAAVFRGRPAARRIGLTLLVVALGCNAVSLGRVYTVAEKEEWRQAAELVAGRVQPGDAILFDQGLVQIPFDHYYRRDGLAVVTYGYPYDYTHWQIQEMMDRDEWWVADYVNADAAAALARLEQAACFGQHTTVWLVTNRPLSEGKLAERLAAHSQQVEVYEFNRVTVHRFLLQPDS
ncbi:MAG: glycosyltransferase family 39 protein [Anaerolineae bacterium]|nr:glycosyltransferase family 39 protein [Anaerolineae bacterium]